MFLGVKVIFIFLAFNLFALVFLIYSLRKIKSYRNKLLSQRSNLEHDASLIDAAIKEYQKRIANYFFFYELTQRIAPILDKDILIQKFVAEIRCLGEAEVVEKIIDSSRTLFELPVGEEKVLKLSTSSPLIIENISYLGNLLNICGQRTDFYYKFTQLSIYDSLTGLFNRRYFNKRFLEEFNRLRNQQLSISLLMIDIDYFKKINDTYGHIAGDVVLKGVAEIIKEIIREVDFCGRYGGEEFIVVLPQSKKTEAIMVAERISEKIFQTEFKSFDDYIRTTISVGVASSPENTLYPDMLIETADKALYKAKQEGRNRVCWF